MRIRNLSQIALVLSLLPLLLTGCRNYQSYWVNVKVVNHSGQSVQDVEVDYPSASFGIDSLKSEAVYHYRLKISGSGKIHAQYAGPMGTTIRVDGPILRQNQQGDVAIQLLPQNKILFSAHLTMEHGNHFGFR